MYWHIVPMMMFVTSLILPRNNNNNINNIIENINKENKKKKHDNKRVVASPASKSKHNRDKWFGIGRRQFYQQSVVVGAAVLYPTTTRGSAAAATVADDVRQDTISPSNTSTISSSKKPSAPTSALLPATRAKIWIENSHKILEDTSTSRDKTLEDLNYALTHRPILFVLRGEEPLSRISSPIFAQFTAKKGNGNNNNNNNNSNNPLSSSPGAIISKALNRADEARQWGMLQSQESKNERQNELRAAFNFYTQQLEFDSNSYAWTGSAEERSRRIRDDRIPTPKSVIVSDLDLRDLYRNQLLTALDDATAEVNYQFRQQQQQQQKESNTADNTGEGEKIVVDLTDTVDLMNQVYVVCTKWFDMIDISDVEKAEDVVRNEQQSESIITSK
jgi:hypothetical protein